MDHEPVAEQLLAHLQDRYGIASVAATKLSIHKTYVFRVDRNDSKLWAARAFPPCPAAQRRRGQRYDLATPGRQHYPAERLAPLT